MQRLYWRPAHVSWQIYLLIGVIAVAGLVVVERFKGTIVQPHYEEKIRAARLMEAGMETIRDYRVRDQGPVDLDVDPTGSGMLGLANSPISTNTGALDAKRTSVNPNWAAVVVDLLKEAGVQAGDTVAVGVSGSFPALNLAAYIGTETIGARPIVIASVGASTWGANIPTLTWLDMERILYDAKIIHARSSAASLGGAGDRGIGMEKRGRRWLRDAIERNGIPFLATESDLDSIERRMQVYNEQAGGARTAAYINVGGSIVSIGPKTVKHLYQPGLNWRLPPRAGYVDSVLKRFIDTGVPVLNLSKVVPLAELNGFPVEPQSLPAVGEGDVFVKREYNRWLVGVVLAVVLFSLYALLKLDIGARLSSFGGAKGKPIEPMV